MSQKYTAEEVRAIARRLHDDITVKDGDALAASDMLTAYAERIKADESAVTAEVVQKAVQAFATSLLQQREEGGSGHHKDMRAALLAVWPSGPAQPTDSGLGEDETATVASMRAELVAKIGDCCMGGDPLCTGGCLAEKAAKRNAEREAALAAQGQGDRDAYEGARHDLLEWKRRALSAESVLRSLGYRGIIPTEAPASPAGVPDGWVLVPREPTEAMQTAHHIYGDTSDWWSAVIAATSSAPEGESHE